MRNAFCWRRVSCLAGLSDGRRSRAGPLMGLQLHRNSFNWILRLFAFRFQSTARWNSCHSPKVSGEIILTSHTRYLKKEEFPTPLKEERNFKLLLMTVLFINIAQFIYQAGEQNVMQCRAGLLGKLRCCFCLM